MAAVLDVIVSVTKDGTVEINKVKRAADQAEKSTNKLTKSSDKMSKSFAGAAVKIALVATAAYGVVRAFKAVIMSGIDYNISMDASTAKLTAMVSASKGYETISGRQVTAMERQAMVAGEVSDMMEILKKTNKETAMGMSELIDIYSLAKPGMDRFKWALEDQIEILKLTSNTASNFGMSAQELSTGIDDLAAGTWIASSGFGKMMKALGVTKAEFKATGDKVAYLRDMMRETGAAQDTWAVAVSNFGVAWDEMTGEITKPVFDKLKNSIKDLTKWLGEEGVKATEAFSKAFVEFSKIGVKVVGFVLKAVSQLVHALALAYKGYQKLSELAGIGAKKVASWADETVMWFKNIGAGEKQQIANARQLMEHQAERNKALKGNYDRLREIEGAIDDIITSNNKSKDAINLVVGSFVEYKSEVKETGKEVDKLAGKVSNIAGVVGTKGSKKQIKDDIKLLRKGLKSVSDEYAMTWKEIGNGFIDALTGGDIRSAFKNLFTDSLNMLIPGLGKVFGAIGALFSSHVTQAEIEAATGRVEFSDDSLRNLENVFADAQYPMLEVTNKMHKHIRNMDANFYSVARALTGEASAGGVDLTGATFADTFESGFLGFSSKAVSLISTGLAFEMQNLAEMMDAATLSVRGYTTTLEESSSFWGLFSSSKIKTAYQDLPPEVISDIANSFADGFEAILLAGATLGIDETQLRADLLASELDLGQIDFTGLSPDEVSDRLSQAFSTAFSGVINGVDELISLTDRYATGSEYALETLIRIATEYDQASHFFGLIGKTFEDGETIQVAQQFTETFTRELGRGFGSGRWRRGVFDPIYETYEETMVMMVDATYTAQMQILDIVASTGGLTEFQDAMGSFMGSFYTETEQLGFLTKSMQISFDTLGISMPQTNDEFRNLLETMDTSTEEGAYLYGQILLLAEGFATMTDATENLGTSMTDMIQNVSDAWLGNLSYLTLMQKAEYASGLLQLGLTDGTGQINTVDAARAAAEIALKTTRTKEEYIPVFERYIAELENEVEDASRTDLLNELRELKAEVVELRTATIDAYIHTGATA